MAKKPGVRTIEVSRQQPADSLDPEPPPPTTHQIDGCLLWPQSAREEDRGWVGLDSWSAALPNGADVTGDDQVRVLDHPDIDPSILWDVSGSPLPYESKRGRPKPKIINLTRVS